MPPTRSGRASQWRKVASGKARTLVRATHSGLARPKERPAEGGYAVLPRSGVSVGRAATCAHSSSDSVSILQPSGPSATR